MAQRVSGTAKKSGVGRTSRLDFATRVSEAQTGRAIPLNLGPMLAVYKNRRRLSVRIEKMPHLARLSAGKNNGDNSWSLALSEIDTLAYLPPEGSANDSVTLSVRLIDLESGGSTLAVLDLCVSPTTTEESHNVDSPPREAQLRALREELEQAKSALKARDADLAQLRQKSQRAESELTRQRIESELGGSRTRKGEVDESKFASLDASLLLRSGDPKAEPAGADDDSADGAEDSDGVRVRKGQAQPSKLIPAEQATKVELVEESARALLAEARRHWEKEAVAALAQAEASWKAEEKTRLAAAEAQWQGQSAAALAQAEARYSHAEKALVETRSRADVSAARQQESARDLERLKQECTELRKRIAEREAALSDTAKSVERTREELQAKSTQALARAEEVWRAEEAARLAAAEAQWRGQSSSAIAALGARAERAEQALAEVNAGAQFAAQRNTESAAEIESLRAECTALRARLAEGDANLARTHAEHERAREKAEREAKEALAKAEGVWQAEAVARLSGLESAWQQKLAGVVAEANGRGERAERALAEANARAERAEHALAESKRRNDASSSRDRDNNSELEQLRQECGKLKAQLDERAIAFADAHTEFDETRKSWRREAETALATAEASWKAGEAKRLAAAELGWAKKAETALKEAQARCEAAEKALAQAGSRGNSLGAELAKLSEESRAQSEHLRARTSENEKLRAEIAELRAVVAKLESALASARSASAGGGATSQRDVEESLAAAQAAWKADEAARLAAVQAQWQRQSETARAELSVRCERAERSAQESRVQAEALAARDQDSRFELRRLREELAVAQGNLASREAELESLRVEQDHQGEREIVLQPDRISGLREFEQERPKPKGHLIRDVVIVACLGVAGVLAYPRLEAYVPQLGELAGNVSVSQAPVPEQPKPVRASAIVVHAANVRAAPSANSATTGTLQPGAKVEPVEKKGNWTFVRIDSPNAAMKEGWIYSEFLQDEKAAAAAKAPAAKAK